MEPITRQIEARIKAQQAAGLYRYPPVIADRSGKTVTIKGRRLLSFASNDYLGLGISSHVADLVAKRFQAFGTSSSSSRLVSAHLDAIIRAERAFADYFGYADALFFPSGYQANLAVIGSLFSPDDPVFFDKHVHASAVAGLTMGKAGFSGFNHNDMGHLEKRIKKNSDRVAAVLTEGLFSMDGDRPDLAGISAFKEKHGFILLVDEAHSFGAIGEGGRGVGRPLADVAVGTLGKAFGFFGAFALLPEGIKEFLFNFSSPLIYSTALPPAHALAAADILAMTAEREDLRKDLARVSRLTRQALSDEGYQVSGTDHILALFVGNETLAVNLSRRLMDQGILIFPARFPTVPLGKAILRISLTALHTEADVTRLVEALTVCHDSSR